LEDKIGTSEHCAWTNQSHWLRQVLEGIALLRLAESPHWSDESDHAPLMQWMAELLHWLMMRCGLFIGLAKYDGHPSAIVDTLM
jgi:hypothetical protein